MTKKKTEEKEKLEQIPCIQYFITFKEQTEVLLDSRSKINIINKALDSQLDFKIWKINVRTQKIDGNTLEIYKMIVSIFFVLNKDSKKRFFEESFLLADVNSDIVLEMLFLTMGNINMDF